MGNKKADAPRVRFLAVSHKQKAAHHTARPLAGIFVGNPTINGGSLPVGLLTDVSRRPQPPLPVHRLPSPSLRASDLLSQKMNALHDHSYGASAETTAAVHVQDSHLIPLFSNKDACPVR